MPVDHTAKALLIEEIRLGWSAVPSRTLAFRPVMDRIIQAAVR